MKEAVFNLHAPLQSDTYYRADRDRYDIYLSDTTRSYEPEYRSHTTSAGEYLDIAFLLKDLTNVTLDFAGATLMFHGRIVPFILDNCKNFTIKNVKIDYDRPFYTQATVYECTTERMRIRLDEGFTCRVDPDHKGLVATAETWEYRMNRNDCLLWLYDMEDREDHSIILALFGEEIYPKDNPPLPIGQILVETDGDDILLHGKFPGDWAGRENHKLLITHEPRDKSVIHTVGGEDITLDHVQVLYGSAMALTGMHTKNITADHFDFLMNADGNGRIVTNNADAIHLFNCSGKITIRSCTMEGLLDDTVNVHGNYTAITEFVDNHTVWCNPNIYGMTPALKLFLPGDKAAVYNGRTQEKKAELTIVSAEAGSTRGGRLLRFQEDITELGLAADDVVENLSANPEVLIENCTFGRFRGTMRLQSRGKTVVRNCDFQNKGLSLLFSGDTTYWFESGPVNDWTVENCQFAYAGSWRISGAGNVAYTEAEPYYHRNITVQNCHFDGPMALALSHADNITVTGNTTTVAKLRVSLDHCGKRSLDASVETSN